MALGGLAWASDLVRRGYSEAQASRRILRFAFGAFVDGGDLRLEHLRHALNGPALAREPVVCLAALFFSVSRPGRMDRWISPLARGGGCVLSDSEQLVLLSRPSA